MKNRLFLIFKPAGIIPHLPCSGGRLVSLRSSSSNRLFSPLFFRTNRSKRREPFVPLQYAEIFFPPPFFSPTRDDDRRLRRSLLGSLDNLCRRSRSANSSPYTKLNKSRFSLSLSRSNMRKIGSVFSFPPPCLFPHSSPISKHQWLYRFFFLPQMHVSVHLFFFFSPPPYFWERS